MAKMHGVGNVPDRKTAERIDTLRLRSDLKHIRYAACLEFARSGRGGYDLWIEANDNIGDDALDAALTAVEAQAARLGIALR